MRRSTQLAVLVSAVSLVSLSSSAGAATSIAQFTFESSFGSIPTAAQPGNTLVGPLSAELGALGGTAYGFHATTSTYSSPVGNGSSHSFSSNGWSINDYYQFNTSTTGFSALSLSYDQVSSSTGPGTFQLAYSTDGSSFSLFGSSYTVPSSPSFGSGSVQTSLIHTFDLSSLTSLENAAHVYFRVIDASNINTGGTVTVAATGTSRIDNFVLSGTSSSTFSPRDLTWNTGSGTWDAVTLNFIASGTPTAYAEPAAPTPGDSVTFSGSQVATVTVQAGGVRPSAVTVNNSAPGTYTFTGGPITGATGIAKHGGGTLVLAAPNTFSGGITVDGGTLVYSADNQLGTGALVFNGGDTLNLVAAGNAAGTHTLTIADIGTTLTVNTNGFNLGYGGLQAGTTGTPVFVTKAGTGNLTFTGSTFVAFGSDFQIQGGSVTLDSLGVTDGIGASRSPGNWKGDLIVAKNQYLNFGAGAASTTYISGGGQLVFKGAGYGTGSPTGATNLSALGSQSGRVVVGNVISVNPDNVGPYRIMIGADFFDCTLQLDAAITGNTDVEFAYDAAGVGGVSLTNGLTILNAQSSYTGKTIVLGGLSSSVQIGIDNALPVATPLSFGEPTNFPNGTNSYTIGALDLNGHVLTVASLASYVPAAVGTNAPRGVSIDGIANGAGSAGTLVINGSATTTYSGGIGAAIVSSNVATPSTNINLTLASTNTGKLTLTGANGSVAYTGTTTISGGTLAYTYAIDQASVQTGPIIVNGTGRLELDQPASASSHVVVAVPVATVSATGTVAVGKVDLTTAQAEVVVASTIASVAGAGKLDLGNNDAIFHSTPASALAYGTNILSSVAGAGTGRDLIATLGIIDNVDGKGGALYSTFDGVSVVSGDTLVKYTYVGDTNLDGVVDANDLANLLSGEAGHLHGWINGDIDYSGTVDVTDYNLLLNSLNSQGASFGDSTGGGVHGAVPEPTTAALFLPTVGLLARRRRR